MDYITEGTENSYPMLMDNIILLKASISEHNKTRAMKIIDSIIEKWPEYSEYFEFARVCITENNFSTAIMKINEII